MSAGQIEGVASAPTSKKAQKRILTLRTLAARWGEAGAFIGLVKPLPLEVAAQRLPEFKAEQLAQLRRRSRQYFGRNLSDPRIHRTNHLVAVVDEQRHARLLGAVRRGVVPEQSVGYHRGAGRARHLDRLALEAFGVGAPREQLASRRNQRRAVRLGEVLQHPDDLQ